MRIETWNKKTKKIDKIKIAVFVLIFALLIFGSLKLSEVIESHILYKTASVYNNNETIDYSFLKPFRNWEVKALENIGARSALSMVVNSHNEKIVFEKNIDEMLPMASLSKIMTAYVALKSYNLDDSIVITKKIVMTEENKGNFKIGERITVEQLLNSMLIESSNDAAVAIAEIMGEEQFVSLMNQTAEELQLSHTHFVDPVGLDPDNGIGGYNYSTAKELALLTQKILKQESGAKIIEIMSKQEADILLADGQFHHKAVNTNEMLKEFPDMIGGKTGQTPIAKQCLLIILPKPKSEGYLINVILGSNDRFQEMKNIINWLNKAFVW